MHEKCQISMSNSRLDYKKQWKTFRTGWAPSKLKENKAKISIIYIKYIYSVLIILIRMEQEKNQCIK